MDTFFSKLARRVADCSSLLCIGLDPHPADLPAPTADAALEFCLRLVVQTAPYAAAFKPNSAFFESYGSEGWSALKQVIEAIRDESHRMGSHIPVILDAKRGDIASTAAAYATASFQHLGVDAITLNPYLGFDSLEPFLGYPGRAVFLLCKTSNPGANDLQDLLVTRLPAQVEPAEVSTVEPGGTLYEKVAGLAQHWNKRDNIGLVVGATQIEALRRVRAAAPSLWFLVPGVGAQGGDLQSALQAGLRLDSQGLLINVSRAIARSVEPDRAAAELRDQINHGCENLTRAGPVAVLTPMQSTRMGLADELLEAGCVRFGQFTLKSGLISPIYLDLRRLVSRPGLLHQAAAAYLPILNKLKFDRLAALPYAALPIGTAISLLSNWPLVYPRKEIKDYGTRSAIEGEFQTGEQVVIIDDLATTGGSKFEAIDKLTEAGLQVRDVVVLIDRQSGAPEALAGRGCRLHAVFTLTELLDRWEGSGKVPDDRIVEARQFLKDWQE